MYQDVRRLALGVCVVAASLSFPAQAALFDCSSEPGYCIGVGDSVIFRYAGTSSSMGLFGTLEVIGDSIVAFPTAFRAESNTATQAGINDNGSVQVIAKSGYQFDSVTIVERGAYNMTGADSVVTASSFMEVMDWNNQISGAYDGTALTLNGPLNNRTGVDAAWRLRGTVDMTGSMWDGVDSIRLDLVNTLTATGNSGTAWIEKLSSGAGLDVSILTTPVPVPAALWLFGTGLLGLLGMAKRRSI